MTASKIPDDCTLTLSLYSTDINSNKLIVQSTNLAKHIFKAFASYTSNMEGTKYDFKQKF